MDRSLHLKLVRTFLTNISSYTQYTRVQASQMVNHPAYQWVTLKKQYTLRLLCLGLLLCFYGTTFALEHTKYASFNYGLKTNFNMLGFNVTQLGHLLEANHQSYKLSGGYFISSQLSVDAQYNHFGHIHIKSVPGTKIGTKNIDFKTTPSSFGIGGTVYIPVTDTLLKPYARLGFHRWNRKGEIYTSGSTPTDKHGNDIFYGMGLVLRMTQSIFTGIEYEHMEMIDADASHLLLTIAYRI